MIEQILATFLGSLEALGELPFLDFCVISVDQNVWNLHATKFTWSSKLGVFEKAGMTEGVVAAAGFIVEDTGDEPDDGIDDEHRGDFPAVADEIADGNFEWIETLSDAVIKPFVASAEDEKSGFVGKLFDE